MKGEETFTDFIVKCLETQDGVISATLIMRREDGSIGYRVFNQETSDTLGLMRVAALSVEHDLISSWRD